MKNMKNMKKGIYVWEVEWLPKNNPHAFGVIDFDYSFNGTSAWLQGHVAEGNAEVRLSRFIPKSQVESVACEMGIEGASWTQLAIETCRRLK